jgi:hypothetical protein
MGQRTERAHGPGAGGGAAGVGWVCGSGEDSVGGRAREDDGRVRAAVGARQAGGRRLGRGGRGGSRAMAGGSWRRRSKSSEREGGRGTHAFFVCG